ncbi:trk system potassium uptake protein TrkH [Albidovulum inexpectatum]|uniref:Trk system potassium uptake protein n=1 Tax=Albidovulum inexpectatum TaxID=196587 RepID=A0A2S5JI42_9RHOB|nr:TrkH family potassium uptake protein [Albidovulum inexpectatum]PPB81133.1 trk system potassium uptake protein TrkH [Albidovulum inexpectatum]
MLDLRPVGFVVGLVVAALGAVMVMPMFLDLALGDPNWRAFQEAAIITILSGAFLSLACHQPDAPPPSLRQAFLLTIGIWLTLPVFGALPFVIGKPDARFLDAWYEAVSGITTTGASVFVDIDSLPAGVHLWRAMLNWLGGLGIAFIAMIFLPVMRVGGMQFFRTEGFDTFGKVLPRARDIAIELFMVYSGLTLLCILVYAGLGMPRLEALDHGLATIATGGFSPRASSFAGYAPPIHYAATAFMLLGSLPYIRYVQLMRGDARALLADAQVRGYLTWVGCAVLAVSVWRAATSDQAAEPVLRETMFNLVSVMSSTGFSTETFPSWGGFAMMVAFWLGIVGACSGSSAAGLSIFRVQVLLRGVWAEIKRMHAAHRVVPLKYDGRPVDADTMGAITLYLGAFLTTFGVIAVLILDTGVDVESALLAAWTTIGNIGYGYGPLLARTGTFVDYPDLAKILMALAMILGRLSLLSVFVIVLPRFWRV